MKIEPGCLAVVVRNTFPENIGRVVTVKAFSPDVSHIFGESAWEIECSTPLRFKNGDYARIGYASESCLRPISGPSIAKHVRLWDELPREATA